MDVTPVGRPKKERDGKPVLTRESIVATAFRMADEHGVEPLSMRKLAAEMGVGAMSIYHYVADRDALMDALADEVAAEIDLERPAGPWTDAARHLAISTHEALIRHPWSIPLWTEAWPGPHRFAAMEALLDILANADLPHAVADLGFHALTNHIQGFARQRVAYGQNPTDTPEAQARIEAVLADPRYPHIAQHARYHHEHHGQVDEFTYVLDLILDGLARSS
ncbi:MAG: TetR/AcrR family transcriptional regulator C-terminal domain-containing protein [Actinomycetota bacterium]